MNTSEMNIEKPWKEITRRGETQTKEMDAVMNEGSPQVVNLQVVIVDDEMLGGAVREGDRRTIKQ